MTDLVYVFPLLIFLIFFVWKLRKSGLFNKTEIRIENEPPFISKTCTIFYKHCIGRYRRSGGILSEITKLIPDGAKTFTIRYNDPEQTKEELLQSAVGVVFTENDTTLFTSNYGEQLTRWGYDQLVIQPVQRAVVAKQRYEGIFSNFALSHFLYANLKNFLETHNVEEDLFIEFYYDGFVFVLVPLDHQNEFIIPQFMRTEELETKLARRKWDSDIESDSQSDTERDDIPYYSEVDENIASEDPSCKKREIRKEL